MIAGKSKCSSHTKHVAVKFGSLKQWIEEAKLVLKFVSSKDQLSVAMTNSAREILLLALGCTYTRLFPDPRFF